jgi:hypothetical protein
MVLVGWLAFIGYRRAFPPPYTDIGFQAQHTAAVEGQPVVRVTVLRRQGGQSSGSSSESGSAQVRYHTVAGNARAGVDYVQKEGTLFFAPEESGKVLEIALLPGGTDSDLRKSFSIELDNVEGRPQHVVVLEPFKADADTLAKADALVRAVSGLAIDLAKDYVKIKTYHAIANAEAFGPNRSLYERRVDDLKHDMADAQARYLQVLKDLATLDTRSVLHGFDLWQARLDQQDLRQQAAATRIAREQYRELLQSGRTNPDIWLFQLSQAIPKTKEKADGVGPV